VFLHPSLSYFLFFCLCSFVSLFLYSHFLAIITTCSAVLGKEYPLSFIFCAVKFRRRMGGLHHGDKLST
jgi:hypothetical protein